MKMICKLLVFLFVFGLVSCAKDNDPVVDESDLLLGYWINPGGYDSILIYDRTGGLKKDAYGIGFKAGGLFVERKSEGWCATPPVIMKDFQGTWTRHDSLIDISVPYWGGTAHYQWKIIRVDRSSLTVAFTSQEFQE
jgi:hypothetical protein